MIQELHTMNNTELMDILAKHTSDFTKMISDNMMGDEYEKCKLKIKAIQAEIDARKNNFANNSEQITTTTPPDFV